MSILFTQGLLTVCLFLGTVTTACSQLLEAYAGHQRSGADILWYRYFTRKDTQPSPWLFFSRNRASADYKGGEALLASTQALSINHRSGAGLVLVSSFVNRNYVTKAGVQYVHAGRDWLFFGWLVADLQRRGGMDLFGLFRFQPAISGDWKALIQLELFPVYHTGRSEWNCTERIRLGAKHKKWGGGWMLDLNQRGKKEWNYSQNTGIFLRYDF